MMVTGAAGSLGGATARRLLRCGARLVLVDHAEEKLAEEFPHLVENQDHYLAAPVDLTKADQVEAVAQEALSRFGQVHALINIAGGFQAGDPVHETSLDTWEFMLNLNARSVLLTCRAVVPHMLSQGRGKIVNIGARPGLQARANAGAYAASKSAVIRLTESLSAELKPAGINANCLIPGTMDTPGNRQSMPDADHDSWVKPAAVADVIAFLVSDQARAIHGAVLPVLGLT